MEFETKKIGKCLTVKPLAARIDSSVSLEFKQRLTDFIAAGHDLILLNMADVEFVDSSGLGAIVSGLKLMGRKGGIGICCTKDPVRDLFKLTRLDRVFDIFPTQEEALEKL